MPYKRPIPHQHSYDVEKYKIEYISLQGQGWNAIANASDQADIAINDAVVSAGAGNPSFGEVGTTGVTALLPDAAGDLVSVLWPIPYDCDVKSPIEFAVQWGSSEATLTDTVTFKVLYTEHTLNVTALTAAATALSTAIAADTNVAGVSAVQQTAYGILNGGTVTNGNLLTLDVEIDAVSGGAANEVAMYTLVIRYIRRAL